MKTLFITSFNPFISRNILSTDVLGVLSEKKDLRVVILVPDYKVNYFKEKFARGNVIIEGFKVQQVDRQDVIFRFLTGSVVSTSRLKIRHKELLEKKKEHLKYFVSRIISHLSFRSVKKLIQFFDYLTIDKNKFESLLKKYKPDVVFSTDIFHNDDIHLVAEAKAKGIKTISMVRSWDNITNKGLFRIAPEKLVVHNEVIKNQAVKFGAFNGGNIFVSGIPQFDEYVNGKRTPREDFFRRIGLNPLKKTILIAPHGERFHHTDWQLIKILADNLSGDFQFIVRFPPNDTVNLHDFKPDERFYIEKPGVTFKEGRYNDREIKAEDTKTLADDIFHSDVLINYGSTVTIDAIALNKPAIIVAFDGWENLPYIKSVRRFLDYDHVKLLTGTGAAKIAHNKEELLEQIYNYIKDPTIDSTNREKLKKEQIWSLDGKAGERIANFILENI